MATRGRKWSSVVCLEFSWPWLSAAFDRMFRFLHLYLVSMLFLLSVDVSATELHDPWFFIDLPVNREESIVKLLESKGMVALAWSNALVEVSVFEGLETIPLASLNQRLLPQDPRWDPWLAGLGPYFRPRESVSRIWVQAAHREEAQTLLAHENLSLVFPEPGPRRVTGWILFSLSLLYLVFRVWSDVEKGEFRSTRKLRSWLWLPLTLVLMGGGIFLVGSGSRSRDKATVSLAASWIQHFWYQESWPYGATWKDWSPGKAWSYRSYDRKDGRLFEVMVRLPVPDKAWVLAAEASLAPHHAARIVGLENP
jgi:hypothetical protein